jgi:ubiquinone/menaquinone biosynthesis C-methylase UbiE
MPNPYPQPFLKLYGHLCQAREASTRPRIALDLGSGGRALPGLISMEWADWPDNTLRGDCLALPFRDNCADLILSQAVLEHVTNPDLAMQEMFRVLRPGGILYVEIAFMQPVHMPPHHYFNVTPHGLIWMLRDWDVIEQGELGTFGMVIDWLFKEVGIPAPRLSARQQVMLRSKYAAVAYGVYATARKPVE